MWGSPLKTHFAQIPKRWNKIEIWSIVSAMNVLRMYDIFNHYPWSQAKGLLRRTHLPLQNICLRALFTNTQICEHERQSQTLLHTSCLAEFSNYAELCTFKYAWSTAEEERRIGMSGLLISDSLWQVCGGQRSNWSRSNWSSSNWSRSNWSSSNWSKF